jgi:hypothetical protein
MTWEIEYTDDFGIWWEGLDESEQVSVDVSVGLLEEKGPDLGYPHSSNIQDSQLAHLRELRIQHRGQPYRVLYAFDPRRVAILLLGGKKTGDDRWYKVHIPKAEKLYAELLEELKKEGLI